MIIAKELFILTIVHSHAIAEHYVTSAYLCTCMDKQI